FLKDYRTKVIHNGIDLKQFRILNKKSLSTKISHDKKVVLGVASVWEERKGLQDFIELSKCLPEEYQIVVIGLNNKQKKQLPDNIISISRTESIEELTQWYNRADVFVNPT